MIFCLLREDNAKRGQMQYKATKHDENAGAKHPIQFEIME
jgi:hypothetical protein